MEATDVSGGVGGNIAGALLKWYSLGPVGNTIVGVISGGLGGQLLGVLGLVQSTGFVGDLAGSAVGGGVLMTIVGLIKGAMENPSFLEEVDFTAQNFIRAKFWGSLFGGLYRTLGRRSGYCARRMERNPIYISIPG